MGGGRQVQQSTWTNGVGRLGLVAYGLLHLVLAWIAGQLAFGDGASDQASGTGALQELAQAPLGAVLVWAVAVGLAGLAAWSVLEAGWGHREFDGGKRTRKRLVSLARAPVFAVLSGAAVRVALQDSGRAPEAPAGPVAVRRRRA